MAKLIMRSICAFALLVLAGLSGAAVAATPPHDPPLMPSGAASAPAVERMAGCRSYRCYGLRKGCRVLRDPYLRDYYIRCPEPRWVAPPPQWWW